MHHGNGPQNVQRQLQRSKSITTSEPEELQPPPLPTSTLPQSPATSFAPAASPSAPQSPNYQIIMSRSPVTGQNMNITLQNVGQMMAAANPQITLTPLPLPNPGSPGFQHSAQQWRFEHAPPSYIQVTSPLPPQSPSPHSPVPVQRTVAPGTGLTVCGQSPTRGLMDTRMLVRQISISSPSSTGPFVYPDGAGLTQLASSSAEQVQLASPGTPGTVRERRLSQPHSQTGGTIHHLGPQSPAASGAAMQTLGSPGHITTSNLPPQISSIIQGQLIQQHQVHHGQQLSRTIGFERSQHGMLSSVGGATTQFGMTSPLPPPSPSRVNVPQGIVNPSHTPTSATTSVKRQHKKLEEIAPATAEIALLRKQCLEHHTKKMEGLKEVFKEYLIELFFLQHLQGNMMDFVAFKKKPCALLYTYLRQNDLDLEDDEEEEQSEVINDEVKVVTGKDGQTGTPVAIATQLPPNVSAVFSSQQQQQFQQTHQGTPVAGTANTVEIEAFKRQQVLAQADQAKRPRIEVGRHGMVFQHPGVAPLGSPGVPLQQLMPTVQGGMPPAPQNVQISGQKQNQQQYDPSKGPPVKNAASLHTPPPQLPNRLQANSVPLNTLPPQLQLTQQQMVETQMQPQPPVKVQQQPPLTPVSMVNNTQTQLQTQLQQQMQPGPHLQMQTLKQSQPQVQPVQESVGLIRPNSDSSQASQRLLPNSAAPCTISTASLGGTVSSTFSFPPVTNRTSPASNMTVSPVSQSKLTNIPGASVSKISNVSHSAASVSQDNNQEKQAEQIKLENHVHQRIAELRKEGLWSVSRLPKLQEGARPKSHWDYLLEEMQWMAADFAQERRWKMAAAKKLVRTCARSHKERMENEERAKKEGPAQLRRIAGSIAREVEYFWSNIEQVVEVKLQIDVLEKKRKSIWSRRKTNKDHDARNHETTSKPEKDNIGNVSPAGRKRKVSTSFTHEAAGEENTIQVVERSMDHKTELTKDDVDLTHPETIYEEIHIDSLLNIDQYRSTERLNSSQTDPKNPKKDITEVAAVAELLLPKGSARIVSAVRNAPPFLLHGNLREYQQIGVDWLSNLYRNQLNGILADETGLGKTVQTIAFLAYLACIEGNWGPHLVVVRTCKILNWEMELKRWCPGFKVLLYLGHKKERELKRRIWSEPNAFHVCVTSYKLLLRDRREFLKRRWKYLVLDEVQLNKNMSEKHWNAIMSLKSQRRVLLINTPLQNTLKELWTMVHFLIPGIAQNYLDFPVKAGTDENQEYCHKLVIRLHRMIQPFILRRTKRDVEKQLPKKYEHILKCRLSKRQKILYEDVMTQTAAQEALKTGHFVSVLHVLMQLQRICNHPDLIHPRTTQSTYIFDALQYIVPSLILGALEYNRWKTVDMSIFDLIGSENRLSRYETEEVLPKQKITRKLIEEIFSSPDPPNRPKPMKIKPSRLFQPVQYGQKPEGKTVVFPGAQTSHATTTTTTSASQQSQIRGRSPITTVPPSQGGEIVKIAHLPSIAGSQNRVSPQEAPVTLQFQGNKFTLSPSQLRQLTTGQPLQLQGNILQIVSAPGQQLMRSPGSVVMQTAPQTPVVPNATTTPIGQHGATAPLTSAVQASSAVTRPTVTGANLKPLCAVGNSTQESSEEKTRLIKEKLDRLFEVNERRCNRSLTYGTDLLKVCSLSGNHLQPRNFTGFDHSWRWIGNAHCVNAQNGSIHTVSYLKDACVASEQSLAALQEVTKRFHRIVQIAIALPPHLYASNPPPHYSVKMKLFRTRLQEEVAPFTRQLKSLTSGCFVEMPDLHLLQMDSGKLEALSVLLRKLKSEGRRVLIFTQMVKMLDILELFLNYLQLTYVRIDENAPLQDQQDKMRQFNRRKQIFCTILSNRCCSVVGNVFDADTVIFYDTDLNPTMDSKTQDWCDRIGRSKDIHIYRLESGNSIEEKLLKNGTKDLIREVAAQGTDYTLAFLTQRTIQDLFEVECGSGEKVEEFVVLHQEPSPSESISPKIARPYIQALNSIGEESFFEDPKYTKGISEMNDGSSSESEFYENEPSRLEELVAVIEQLTPIERYALQYLEFNHTSSTVQEETRERKSNAKKLWESEQLKKIKIEMDDQLMLAEEEELLTYTREDAYNMEYVYDGPDGETEIMPLWTPPTPPQDDNDIYIDSVICLMYDMTPMPESKLPPIYVRKEHKRLKMDSSAVGRKKKQRHGETVIPPRSLFDKASILKVRREGKDQKKNFSLKQQAPFPRPLPSLVKPTSDVGQDSPEWLISEDWALLQAVKQLLELPLNLSIISPAHTPNWDMVSDVVNSCSRIYRSPKQCRSRYENVIIPREEGKLVYETPKKKTKNLYKAKNNRPLRTSQIYIQDDCATHVQLYNSRFEMMKMIASKRNPPLKPVLGMNPFQKNPKHASVLAESGINYDKPLPPIQVASQRAERIAKEKKALAEQQRAQQLAQQQQQQQQQQQPQQAGTPQNPQPTAPQAQAQQPIQVSQAQATVQVANTVANTTLLQSGTMKTTPVGTSLQNATVGGNVILNTLPGVAAASFPSNKQRLASPVISNTLTNAGASTPQVLHAQQRTVTTPAAPTEVVAIAANQSVRTVAPVTAPAVVSTTLAPVQTQTRPAVTQVPSAAAPGMPLHANKPTLAHAQLLIRQQQQQQQAAAQVHIQGQVQAPSTQIKSLGKPTQDQLLKQQQTQQLATMAGPRGGPVLTSAAAVTSLQVTRMPARMPTTQIQSQGQIPTQAPQTAQVTLTKSPVAVVPSPGVTLPVTMGNISVAIGQSQKAGGQVAFPPTLQLLQLKKQGAAQVAPQQKAVQPQVGQGQPAVQQKLAAQSAQPQQKVAYAALKTQYLATPVTQAQKSAGTQQVQAQLQVAKLPQIVQQQAIANIPQMVPAPQQIQQPQTVTLSQAAAGATSSGQQQVQVMSTCTMPTQVVQTKLIQQPVVTATSPQIQTPPPHSPAQTQVASDAQAKVQVRTAQAVRGKAPTKPT
ncbi:E1A-binding protein p400 isoform X4 [Erpetoichthys calabaricus]|uniref:E1A-binding protein p400 isoform X4 n=1 Tax=Erpetoichthys calabaricus TaxID=27687 RepID=UPI00223409BD|nr:E1A-binding protein p400 isoform X4 [Erpetoichthys calabaricus]